MNRVLDAHALMVYLEKEPGYEKVQAAFLQAIERGKNILITSVNFGEVYYIILRECGQKKAEEIEKIIRTLPIEIVDVDIDISREAARFKTNHKISYADCFAAALTKMIRKSQLLTGDKEFEELKDEIKILWI